jgi:phosphomannomutase
VNQHYINHSIYRAYDIRGKVDENLTVAVALLIGKAFGTYIQKIVGN